MQCRGNVQMEGGGRYRRKIQALRLPFHQAQKNTRTGDGEDTDQDRRAHSPRQQRGDEQQPAQSQRCGGLTQIAHGDQSRRAGYNDSGVPEADEGDEKANPHGHRGVQFRGNRGDDELTDAHCREQQKCDSGQEHRTESCRPGDSQAFHHRVSEIRVQPHAWRERNGIPRQRAHQDAAEPRAQACRHHHGRYWHPRLMQDGWIHEDDVRHRDEGGEAGQNLGAPVRAELLEFEVPLEAPESRSGGHDGRTHCSSWRMRSWRTAYPELIWLRLPR